MRLSKIKNNNKLRSLLPLLIGLSGYATGLLEMFSISERTTSDFWEAKTHQVSPVMLIIYVCADS